MRKKWHQQTHKNEQRFAESAAILSTIFKRYKVSLITLTFLVWCKTIYGLKIIKSFYYFHDIVKILNDKNIFPINYSIS